MNRFTIVLTTLIIVTLTLFSCGLPSQIITSLNSPRINDVGENRYGINIPNNSDVSTGLILQYRIFVNSREDTFRNGFYQRISNERTGEAAFIEADELGYRTLVHSSISDTVTINFSDYSSFFTQELLSAGIESNSVDNNIELNYDRTDSNPNLLLVISGTSIDNPITLNLRRNSGGELKDFSLNNIRNYEESDADIDHISDELLPNIRNQDVRLSIIAYMFRERENFGPRIYSQPFILAWDDLLILSR